MAHLVNHYLQATLTFKYHFNLGSKIILWEHKLCKFKRYKGKKSCTATTKDIRAKIFVFLMHFLCLLLSKNAKKDAFLILQWYKINESSSNV